MRDGKFRADLYHRVSVFPIRVPPLRERREDIPRMVWACIEKLGRHMGKSVKSIPRKSMEQLQTYSWPGNVRELNNVIERAMILSPGPTLLIEVPALGSTTGTTDFERGHARPGSSCASADRVANSRRGRRPRRFWGLNQRHWNHGWPNWALSEKSETPIFRRNLRISECQPPCDRR